MRKEKEYGGPMILRLDRMKRYLYKNSQFYKTYKCDLTYRSYVLNKFREFLRRHYSSFLTVFHSHSGSGDLSV